MKKLLLLPIYIISSLTANSQFYTAGTIYPFYTDISPNYLLCYTVAPYTHQVYGLNIFGDTLFDVEFIAHGSISSGGTGAYINVTSLDPNVYISFGRLDSVFVPATSGWNITKVAKPLNAGEQINSPGVVWDNTTLYLTDHSGAGGGTKDVNDWIGGDKYLGLKYQTGPSTWFGWIRLQCFTEDSCYVKDLSSSVASVDLDERISDETTMYPNPISDIFYIKNTEKRLMDISKLRISDLYGNEIKFTYEAIGNDLQISISSTVANGCYVLNYFSDEYAFTKKLVKISK